MCSQSGNHHSKPLHRNACKIKDTMVSKLVKKFRVLQKLESSLSLIIKDTMLSILVKKFRVLQKPESSSVNLQLIGNAAQSQGILLIFKQWPYGTSLHLGCGQTFVMTRCGLYSGASYRWYSETYNPMGLLCNESCKPYPECRIKIDQYHTHCRYR